MIQFDGEVVSECAISGLDLKAKWTEKKEDSREFTVGTK